MTDTNPDVLRNAIAPYLAKLGSARRDELHNILQQCHVEPLEAMDKLRAERDEARNAATSLELSGDSMLQERKDLIVFLGNAHAENSDLREALARVSSDYTHANDERNDAQAELGDVRAELEKYREHERDMYPFQRVPPAPGVSQQTITYEATISELHAQLKSVTAEFYAANAELDSMQFDADAFVATKRECDDLRRLHDVTMAEYNVMRAAYERSISTMVQSIMQPVQRHEDQATDASNRS